MFVYDQMGRLFKRLDALIDQFEVIKTADAIVLRFNGSDEAKQILRDIRRMASEILICKNGEIRTKTSRALEEKYSVKVISVEEDERTGEVLTRGLLSSLGIILFE